MRTLLPGWMPPWITDWTLLWTLLIPPLALVSLLLTWTNHDVSWPIQAAIAILLAGSVLAAVEHAEVVAHKVGEPFGSLLLAVAVTIIEVGMIIMLMVSKPTGTETLARDTVFAATMITTNLIIGLALFLAAGRRSHAYFNREGSGTAFSAVAVLATATMVLPAVTTSSPAGTLTRNQLFFIGAISLITWAFFVLTQTRHHRDFFLPVTTSGKAITADDHASSPSTRHTVVSTIWLIIALVSVVGLSKVLSPTIETTVAAAGLPDAVVGLVIAMLVLLPETIAATKNALAGRTQIALNLGYGSALASIGLTIPIVGIIATAQELPFVLGLTPLHLSLLALTGVVTAFTLSHGRAVRLQGGLHLIIAAAFIFLVAFP